MAINLSVVKNLENNRVLIQEQSGKKNSPRLYSVPQENADKFISERKAVVRNNKIQKIMTYVTSAVIGLIVGSVVKFGTLGKVISGLVTGGVALTGSYATDKAMNKKLQANTLKNFDVEEVTDQKSENIK